MPKSRLLITFELKPNYTVLPGGDTLYLELVPTLEILDKLTGGTYSIPIGEPLTGFVTLPVSLETLFPA